MKFKESVALALTVFQVLYRWSVEGRSLFSAVKQFDMVCVPPLVSATRGEGRISTKV